MTICSRTTAKTVTIVTSVTVTFVTKPSNRSDTKLLLYIYSLMLPLLITVMKVLPESLLKIQIIMLSISRLMLYLHLINGDFISTQYLYFEINLFSYIIDITSGTKPIHFVQLFVFNYFVTKVLSNKLLNVEENKHTDL